MLRALESETKQNENLQSSLAEGQDECQGQHDIKILLKRALNARPFPAN